MVGAALVEGAGGGGGGGGGGGCDIMGGTTATGVGCADGAANGAAES